MTYEPREETALDEIKSTPRTLKSQYNPPQKQVIPAHIPPAAPHHTWVEVKPDRPYNRFIRWSDVEVGAVISGFFAGWHVDKFNLRRLLVEVHGEILSFSLPAVLKAKLCGEDGEFLFGVGDALRIEYLGLSAGSADKSSYHKFRVWSGEQVEQD